MKKCTKCGIEKPTDLFHRNAKSKDGFTWWCKDCTTIYHKKWLSANKERSSAASTAWKKQNRDRVQAANAEWARNNPEKLRARRAVENALRVGRLIKKPCAICGDDDSYGHHPDYEKPLEVIWLCRDHHVLLHRFLDLVPDKGIEPGRQAKEGR